MKKLIELATQYPFQHSFHQLFQNSFQQSFQKKKLFSKFALSAMSLSIYQISHAAVADNVIDFAPAVVVAKAKTGTALGQKISEMPAVTQIIDEQQIAKQITGNRMVGEVLAQLVPSISASSASTSNYTTTMRGRTVQYLINGVPLTGARDISRQLNSISPSQLERIEVLSGATSIYGAGATGGLINLVTKSADDINGFYGQTRVGMSANYDFNSDALGYSAGQTLGFANDKVFARLDVDYKAKGGKFDSDGKRISTEIYQTDQQDSNTLSVNANLGVNIDDNQGISLAATHYNNQQDTDYGIDFSPNLVGILRGSVTPSLKAVAGAKLDDQPYTTQNSVSLNYHHDDLLGSNLSVTGYYRNEKGRFYPFPSSFAGQATAFAAANGVTDRATLKKLVPYTYTLNQSEADISVAGVRAALQTETKLASKNALFSYGVDFESEQDKQTYHNQDISTYIASNGLTAKNTGRTYFAGPNTTIEKLGAFVNADIDLTKNLHASAGVRYQNINAETDKFNPVAEELVAGFSQIPAVQALTNTTYSAKSVAAGSTEHSKALFNLGASYQLSPADQIFANFSQGFSIADVQRALRDVPGGFVVNSDNVQPIAVNSYELGWQGNFANSKAKITGFYNDSNKTVRFTSPAYLVEIVNTDERVYGAEASLTHDVNERLTLGSSIAVTRGQFKDENSNDWSELDATRISPIKGSAFAQYNTEDGSSLRLQALAIQGTDKAFKENGKSQPITGYATFDLLGKVQLPKGHIDYGIYNLLNKEYKTVYHQSAYGPLNRLDAAGRHYGISYTIDY